MHYLTSLRGVAAILVVLYHIKHWLHLHPTTAFLQFSYNKGYLAVDFFFILSGFIIAYNYNNEFTSNINWRKYLSFIKKRFARVYPLHAFILILYISIPLALFLTDREIRNDQFEPSALMVKFLLIDLWLIDHGYWNSWNAPSWTISGEFFAYLLFPLMLRFTGASYVRSVLTLILCCVVIAIAYELTTARSLGDNIARLGLLRCTLGFMSGICIHNIYKANVITDAKKYGIALYSSVGMLCIMLYSITANHFYVPLMFSLTLLCLVGSQTKFHKILETRWLVFLGEISYSVYLSHTLLLSWFSFLVLDSASYATLPQIICYFGLVIIFSCATYIYIEVPCRRWLNLRFFKHAQ